MSGHGICDHQDRGADSAEKGQNKLRAGGHLGNWETVMNVRSPRAKQHELGRP